MRLEKNMLKIKTAFEIIIVIIAIASAVSFVMINNTQTPVNEEDAIFQANTKSLTGYDWQNKPSGDSENAKAGALLLLAAEIDSLHTDIDEGIYLEAASLPARLDAQDVSKENVLLLIDDVAAIESLLPESTSLKTRIERLSSLKDYVSENGLPEGEINAELADAFAQTMGIVPKDYSRAVTLMIINYNLFISQDAE